MLGKQAALGPYLANLGHARDILYFCNFVASKEVGFAIHLSFASYDT